MLIAEACSKRYGLGTNKILKLSQGQWALFSADFVLQAIVEKFADLEQYVSECKPPMQPKQKLKAKINDINLEDLGL